MNVIEKALFETEAFKISDERSPFWYTSGTIGPFFINTHFLYGNEEKANELLSFIDKKMYDRLVFCNDLHDRVINFYKYNPLYKSVIDKFYEEIKDNEHFKNSIYVSGGERRDWFFSIPIAYLSDKKILFIFKDMTIYSLIREEKNLRDSGVSHIADLITAASSYERAWIPAIKNSSGNLVFSGSIVDRMQGGKEFLESNGIKTHSSVKIDDNFFKRAKESGIINELQYNSIVDFTKNSIEYGKNFILNNKSFLFDSLNSNNKSTFDKANRCVKENPYNIDFSFLNL